MRGGARHGCYCRGLLSRAAVECRVRQGAGGEMEKIKHGKPARLCEGWPRPAQEAIVLTPATGSTMSHFTPPRLPQPLPTQLHRSCHAAPFSCMQAMRQAARETGIMNDLHDLHIEGAGAAAADPEQPRIQARRCLRRVGFGCGWNVGGGLHFLDACSMLAS